MDVIQYSQSIYDSMVIKLSEIMKKYQMISEIIPISTMDGENLVEEKDVFQDIKMNWFKGIPMKESTLRKIIDAEN
jgi:translation elongation factor EF-1alpha